MRDIDDAHGTAIIRGAGENANAEDIDHYQRIVVALAETQRLQREIDAASEAHGGWPLS